MTVQKDKGNDGNLFRKAMAQAGVIPLDRAHNRRAPEAPRPKPAAIRRRARGAATGGAGVLIDETADGDTLLFARGGLQKKVLRKLKRGDYPCTGRLDLHGCSRNKAKLRLERFLRQALDTGACAVLIIPGKGLRSGQTGGVLKDFTASWLKRHPAVRAFCSALPRDGGTGALYVLLRVRARR